MTRSLDEYHGKRDFDATPEPSEKAARPRAQGRGKNPRGPHAPVATGLQFCVQKHDASHLHYDFRLELDGTLKSWAIPKGPSLDPKVKRLAVHVEDHPLDYARFEGHIPDGHYGAGDVIVWDQGIWLPEGDPAAGYARGRLRFTLRGVKLHGAWHLVRTHMPGKREQWFLIKANDTAARAEAAYDVLAALPHSVLDGGPAPASPPMLPMPALPSASLPAQLQPALATLVDTVPAGDWRYEIKFDGYRILARIDAGDIRLYTRNGHDWTARMPRQQAALAGLKMSSGWLDGEVVVAGKDGLPDFQALQNAFDAGSGEHIVYYLFDMPYFDGADLRTVALEDRRAALAALLQARGMRDGEAIRFSEDFAEGGADMLASACHLKLEGLIGKRAGSPYVSRRSTDWIKLKCQHRQEFVIAGFTDPAGGREGFGALLLALHDTENGALRYAGRVGTGFSRATLRDLATRLQTMRIRRTPMQAPPTGAEARAAHWVRPELLAEIAYADMTRDGRVRHAVFHGLRNDKAARDITAERPETLAAEPAPPASQHTPKKTSRTVPSRPPPAAGRTADVTPLPRITHPDRILDATSGTTKMALAEYYARLAGWLLPHLRERPVALVRAPDGIGGELFFQKNAEKLAIPGMTLLDKELTGQPMMAIDRPEALIGAIQMNAIEFHTWNATVGDLERPDRFVLDLDPDPALPWKSVAEATQLTLAVLDELGLQSFVKTSGGKGMHIVVPLTPKEGWDEVKAFSHAIVKYLAGLLPDRFVAVPGPKNRVGRIFVDYLRNGQGATTIAPFAVRARKGMGVSVPVHRDEVAGLQRADRWTLADLPARLERQTDDPWARYSTTRQTITPEMRGRLKRK
ncbi:DNA ligase D [Robbsia sp. Bb-Pol-6]|uniref:DNA ligase (ATP) n=1 Tax=Robbsia betulipollinis TaxID=2981849 RepID=A0ABT3ZIL2_9BURK|nr:DNA ligase D [Robbsia betulipollinis]MCY0386257.1 DNA ligase D [Robbsia betulipollinis]